MRILQPGLRAKILAGLFVNVVALAALLAWLLGVGVGGGDALIAGRAAKQVTSVARTLAAELSRTPREDWNHVLISYGESYGADFSVVRRDGTTVAGAEVEVPLEVLRRIPPPRALPSGNGTSRGPGIGRGTGPRLPTPDTTLDESHAAFLFFVRAGLPPRHFAAARIPLRPPRRPLSPGAVDFTLLISSDSLAGSPLFFDPRPWMLALAAAGGLTLLIWLPILGGIVRRLGTLEAATAKIARGHFDLDLGKQDGDEIGRLGRSIRGMAAELDHLVTGQRRFLADAAHELCAPLARLRLSIDLLEREVAADQQAAQRLRQVEAEAAELGRLVDGILDFSRGQWSDKPPHRERFPLEKFLRKVVEREIPHVECSVHVETALAEVESDATLLRRMLANLLRNAARHGRAPVSVEAALEEDGWLLRVTDAGDGVPDEWLRGIFEPFSRPDPSRARESGGHGLGLAIARTCALALGGKIRAKNLPQGGFEVEARFPCHSGKHNDR